MINIFNHLPFPPSPSPLHRLHLVWSLSVMSGLGLVSSCRAFPSGYPAPPPTSSAGCVAAVSVPPLLDASCFVLSSVVTSSKVEEQLSGTSSHKLRKSPSCFFRFCLHGLLLD